MIMPGRTRPSLCPPSTLPMSAMDASRSYRCSSIAYDHHPTGALMSEKFDLEAELRELAESKELLKAVSDLDYSKHIVDAISEETGISKLKVKLAYRILVPLIGHLGKGLGNLLIEPVKYRMLSIAQGVPGCEKIVKAIKNACTKTVQEIQANRDAKAYLRDRPASEQDTLEFRKEMSLEFNVAFENLIAIDSIKEGLKNNFLDLREKLATITGYVNPQPKFKDVLADTAQNQLHYLSQHIPFVGRWDDFERLEAFVAATGFFRWQLLAGHGGMGKSRLALEYCLSKNSMFRAGIMTDGDMKLDFSKWQPDKPTILVLDYASKDESLLREILEQLSERRKDLDCKVRLLLLDRETQPEWFKKIRGADTTEAAIIDCRYEHPWEVKTIGDQEILGIMHFILESGPGQSQFSDSSLLERLENLDHLKRPLFAAILAQAISENTQLPKWDQDTLLRHVIERRKTHYWRGVTQNDEALLALATIVGGITSSDDNFPKQIATIRDIANKPRLEIFKSLGGYAREKDGTGTYEQVLPPWEPDIIGELFVLDFLQDDQNIMATNHLREIILQEAWTRNPKATFSFLNRTAQDHPSHPATTKLLECPDGYAAKHVWALLTVNLCYHLPATGNFEDVEIAYSKLKQLFFNNKPNFAILLSKSATNLISAYRNTGMIDAAESFFEDTRCVCASFPDSQNLWVEHARASVNLIDFYGITGKIKEAFATYDNIVKYCSKFNTNTGLTIERAHAAKNLAIACGRRRHIDLLDTIYNDIQTILKEHRANHEINVILSEAIADSTKSYIKAQLLPKAKSALQDLTTLSSNFPDSQGIAKSCAMATANISLGNAYSNMYDDCEELYTDVLSLQKKFNLNQDIGLIIAQLAMNLSILYSEANRHNNAETKFDDIVRIATNFKKIEPITLIEANAAINLVAAYGSIHRWDMAEDKHLHILNLYSKFDNKRTFHLKTTESLYNLIITYSDNLRINEAEIHLKTLLHAELKLDNQQEIKTYTARALANVISALLKCGLVENAITKYSDLKRLYARSPTHQDIAHAFVLATGSIGQFVMRSHGPEKAQNYADKLSIMRERFADNKQISDLINTFITKPL